MSKKKITISTRKRWINTRIVRDIRSGLILEREGYWYDGPMALAGVANTGMDAFRFYASDNSTAIAAQDTDPTTLEVDTTYVLRVRIYNQGNKNEDTTVFQLQYENTTKVTGVQSVTGASSHVRTADATGLTNGTAITSGTLTGAPAGSFINGEEVEDGTPATLVITQGDYTEMHYAFTIQSGDVDNGDNINITVSAPDAGAVTPSITVSEVLTATGSPQAQAATVSASGYKEMAATGSPQAQAATASGTGHKEIQASGTPQGQAATVSASGDVFVEATGSPQAQAATVSASGFKEMAATGSPQAQAATASGSGFKEIQASGSPQTQAATVSGAGFKEMQGSGTPQAQAATVSASGFKEIQASGSPQAQATTVSAAGYKEIQASGSPQGQAVTTSGTGTVGATNDGTGAVQAQAATVSASGYKEIQASGSPQAQSVTTSGQGVVTDIFADGAVQAQAATVSGAGTVTVTITGTGAVQAQAATVSASGDRIVIGTGAVQAQSATIGGTAVFVWEGTAAVQAQSFTASGSAINGPVGFPDIPMDQTVNALTGFPYLSFRQIVGENAFISMPINQTVSNVTGFPALPINQSVGETGFPALPINQSVTDPTDLTSPTYWKASVTLAGTDVSSDLVGQIRIEAEEGAARICEFEMEPPSGAVSLTDWVGASVTVDFVQTDSSGNTTQTWRRFTGVVDIPEYDPVTGIVSFRCTDQLQEILDKMTTTQVDALITNSYWSSDVFDEDVTGWERAQDRLSTVPYSLQLGPARNIQYTAWQAGSADVTFTESEIDDQTLRINLAHRSDLHNVTNMVINYRFERVYWRPETVRWIYPYTFCTYLNETTTLPNVSMVKSALQSTGWLIDSLGFIPLPKSQYIYGCGSTSVNGFRGWVNTKPVLLGFSAKLVQEWTQTVTEQYNISLRADGSISTHGEIAREESFSFETDFDFESYENEPGADPEDADNPGTLRSYSPPSVDKGAMIGWVNAYPKPDGATADSSGDYIAEQSDRTQSDNTIKTVIAQAKTTMLEAHRQNTVSFVTDIVPWLSLEYTARANTTRVDATGKISHLVEVMDVETGEASSEVTIAVSSGGGSVDTTIIAPTAPQTSAAARTNNNFTGLPSHFGNKSGVATYSENWLGYTGNYTSAVNAGGETYPVRLRIDLDAVEDDRRDAETVSTEFTFNVQIPNDSLTITH